MLQLDNKTPLKVFISLFPNKEGIDSIYPVIKATFDLGDTIRLADPQPDFVFADEYLGNPESSSISATAETMPLKPATDLLLFGCARPMGGDKAAHLDVTLRVGSRRKTARVFGDRVWSNGFFGNAISDPIPFDSLPLIYENAYGGCDDSPKDGPVSNPYNPIGKGYCDKKSRKSVEGMSAPNIESPDELILRPQIRPLPVGFGPIPAAWKPRLDYAGTYDQDWQDNRSPYLPKDFDLSFFNVAPEDQQFSPYLAGGEQVEITNVSDSGPIRFQLPSLDFSVSLKFVDRTEPLSVILDTVSIDSEKMQLTMLWRGEMACDKEMLKMEVAQVSLNKTPQGVAGF
ncbi:MAG: DUF2169 domain-containing protein [bacterium]|nr:DUF2169 domain-containing protein [bacterium]